MGMYRYEAVDKSGKTVRGVMNARDEQEVAQRLQAMGYSFKGAFSSAQQAAAVATAASPAPRTSNVPVSVDPSVSLRALARFYRQCAVSVRAGVPLIQTLSEVEMITSNRKLRKACTQMKEQVQGGDRLSRAMAAFPHLFPVHTVGMIWAGEQGGYLDVALDEAATEIETEAKDRLYASIGWLLMNLNIFFLVLIIPFFRISDFLTETMKQAGRLSGTDVTSLASPGIENIPKKIIFKGMGVAYSHFFWQTCFPVLVAWVVVHYVWKYVKRTPAVRMSLDTALLRAPWWGRMHRERAKARFFKTLHRQYEAGVAPAQAWAAASMSIKNSEIARRLRGLEDFSRQSNVSMRDVFTQSGLFEIDDIGMVATGERAGSLPEVFERMGDDHLNIANNAKLKNKVISITWMVLVFGALFVFTAAFVFKSYADLTLNITKLMGLE